MEDLNALKKILEHEKELDEFFGKGNWKVKKVSGRMGGRYPILQVSGELSELGVQPGQYVVSGIRVIDGKPAIVIIPI